MPMVAVVVVAAVVVVVVVVVVAVVLASNVAVVARVDGVVVGAAFGARERRQSTAAWPRGARRGHSSVARR